MHGRTLVSVLATLMVCAFGWAAVAATHTVDAGGGGDFLTIQAAIDAAAPGDTILVAPGTYVEDLNINKAVTIEGAGSGLVTINAGGLPGHNGSGIYVSADNVHLSGFTLIGLPTASLPRYGLKYGSVAGGSISDVMVTEFYRTGIDLLGSSSMTVNAVTLLNNGGHGMQLCDCNDIVVSDAVVAGNGWQGISVCTWGRYTVLGTSGIVITGANTFIDVFQIEEGDYNNPGVPPSGDAVITYSVNLADGADVTVLLSDYAYALHGDQDDGPGQNRVWLLQTLTQAQLIAALPGTVGHLLPTGRYIESLADPTQLYASLGCSIQAAVDAAGDGFDIHVDPAIYTEQIVVNADVDLLASAPGAVIAPGSGLDSFTFAESSRWYDPIILLFGGTVDPSGAVTGTDVIDADVMGFHVDGTNSAGTNRYVGILLRNVNGEVSGNVIDNMYDADGKGNGPETLGILVMGDSDVEILGNMVSDFSRGGIVVQGDRGPLPDPHAIVAGNTVTGNGFEAETGWWAENGIQFGYGASGLVIDNTVTGHWSNSAWTSSGIIAVATENVQILGNYLEDNESAIVVVGYGYYGYGSSDGIIVSGNQLVDNERAISLQMDALNTLINQNVFENCVYGVTLSNYGTAFSPLGTEIHFNSFSGNTWAVVDYGIGVPIDASLNWWGDPNGPSAYWTGGSYVGGGDGVWGDVIFSPWLAVDPDSDPGTHGVQLGNPVLIIVAPVGPEPADGYLNTAIQGANLLPGADTIEVWHGTYDASEPITDPVTMVSEIGSASNTLLNGPIAIDVPDVLLGRWNQGFTINGPITVEAGVDASTVHINWNDLYGLVTNNGLNTLDATFNYWGEDGPDTIGSVNIFPLLPEGSDIIIGYMEDYELNALRAIDFSHLLDELTKAKRALVGIDLMDRFGLTLEQALEIIDEYGWMHVRNALRRCGDDFDRFLILLVGYGIGGPAGGGGSFLGGGAAGTPGISSFCVGCEIPLMLELLHPITGDVVEDATVSFTLCRTLDDGTVEIVMYGVVPFDPSLGAYAVNVETDTLEPGLYDIYLGSDDGRHQHFQIEIFE